MATWQSSDASGRTRARIPPYAWGPGVVRYTTHDDRPYIDPPPELGITRCDGHGVWRVAARWWRDHQPDEGGLICSSCFQFWPCFGFRSAVTILDRIRTRMLA